MSRINSAYAVFRSVFLELVESDHPLLCVQEVFSIFNSESLHKRNYKTPPPFLFVKTIEKVRICTVLIFWVGLRIWAFYTYYIWCGSIYIKTKLNYVKNAHIFKATTQQKRSTQCIIVLLFYCFHK